MAGIFQKAARGAGGFFDRINTLGENPNFALGIGFLQGDPSAGFRNAAYLNQVKRREEAQEQADLAAREQASAKQRQQQFENALAMQKYALDQAKFDRGNPTTTMKEAAALFPGDPKKQRDYIQRRTLKESNGITFTTPDGSVLQVGGPSGGAGLGQKGQNDLDTRRINTADQLTRINQISAVYEERFLRAGERFGNVFLNLKDKGILPGDLSPDEQKNVEEFAQFRQTSFHNLNQTLREMSGAAITPPEAERLRKSLPDPGNGVFDGDGPTQFKAKLDQVSGQLKMALARYNYAAFTGDVSSATSIVSLPEMRNFINERGAEIEQQVRRDNPKATDEQIAATVDAQLKTMFGEFK